jgi:hypothetical protein
MHIPVGAKKKKLHIPYTAKDGQMLRGEWTDTYSPLSPRD